MKSLNSDHFVQVRQTLAGQVMAAKVAARRGTAPTPVKPEASADLEESGGVEAPPLAYHFTYVSGEGEVTARNVVLRRIEPSRDGLRLRCFCHATGMMRDFWAHRIREVFCIVTGEVFDDPVAFFTQHPMLTAPRDPEGYALSVCKHEVNLLVILGASDGLFDADEQDRVLVHVFDRMPELTLNEDVLRHRLALLAPDCAAFDAALLQLGRFRAGDPVALMRTMRKLVDADGHVAPEEVAFVAEVQARLQAVLTPAS